MPIFYLPLKCVIDYHVVSTLPVGRKSLVGTHSILDMIFCIKFLLENETYNNDLIV